MKKSFVIFSIFALCIFIPKLLFAFAIPAKPTGFVNDYANVLSASDKNALESKLSNYEKQTTNEISVVIIPSLDGYSIESVAQDIFTTWGIGKKDKNNGALFLIAINDHKTRIQTGYGLEGTLTDIGTSYIQSEIVRPAFRAGDYAGGINGAVDKMFALISGSDTVPTNYSPSSSNTNTSDNTDGILFMVWVGVIILQFVCSMLARSRSWWAGGILGVIIGISIGITFGLLTGLVATILLGIIGSALDYFVSRRYQSDIASGKSHPWFIGGSGGSGGGGFGGFGGGGSGGGGSSGSW